MVHLTIGDLSGRPDTSSVDRDLAESYATRMFWAVVSVRFATCRKIHAELNQDPSLYVLALDLYRAMCKQRGMNSGRWREYTCE